jgi:hypothetical protein
LRNRQLRAKVGRGAASGFGEFLHGTAVSVPHPEIIAGIQRHTSGTEQAGVVVVSIGLWIVGAGVVLIVREIGAGSSLAKDRIGGAVGRRIVRLRIEHDAIVALVRDVYIPGAVRGHPERLTQRSSIDRRIAIAVAEAGASNRKIGSEVD